MTESPCFPPRTADINFLTSEERTRISNAARTERDAGNSRRRAAQWHDDTLRSLLRHKTDDRSRLWLTDLLQNLTADYGLGWSDIARMVGVSVPAVRKWRHGGDIAPARFNNLARLAAFLDLLTDEGIADPVTWLNLPIDDLDLDDRLSAESITKKEVYIAGGIVDLLAYAKRHISCAELQARYATAVQRQAGSVTRVIRAPDGHLSIVPTK